MLQSLGKRWNLTRCVSLTTFFRKSRRPDFAGLALSFADFPPRFSTSSTSTISISRVVHVTTIHGVCSSPESRSPLNSRRAGRRCRAEAAVHH